MNEFSIYGINFTVETKDIIATVAIVTALVTAYFSYRASAKAREVSEKAIEVSRNSLEVSIANRSNALREHLYKEQVAFLQELRFRFADLMLNQIFIIKANNYQDDDFDKVQTELESLETFIESKGFLLPDDLVSVINICFESADDFIGVLEEKRSNTTDEDENGFYQAVYMMEGALREHIGVDKLSDENLSLIGKSQVKDKESD